MRTARAIPIVRHGAKAHRTGAIAASRGCRINQTPCTNLTTAIFADLVRGAQPAEAGSPRPKCCAPKSRPCGKRTRSRRRRWFVRQPRDIAIVPMRLCSSRLRLRNRPGGGVRCGPCCTSHRTFCRSRKCAAIDLRIGQGCPIPLAWAASLRRALLYWQAIALPGRRAGSRRCSPLALWLGRDVRCLSHV